eukprot:4326678-Alexandrium_andersonii.AAC.1
MGLAVDRCLRGLRSLVLVLVLAGACLGFPRCRTGGGRQVASSSGACCHGRCLAALSRLFLAWLCLRAGMCGLLFVIRCSLRACMSPSSRWPSSPCSESHQLPTDFAWSRIRAAHCKTVCAHVGA